MLLPEAFLKSLIEIKGFDIEAFQLVHNSGEQVTSIRINPSKPITQLANKPTSQLTLIPWTDYGFYLKSRPSFTFDPLFHAGCYYVQEASSMFLEQAIRQTVDLSKRIKVLDLCAAPGGKSTHIHSLISKDSLLVSNEVIRSRANVLMDNIIKWGCENVIVTNNDPKDFTALENYFDVIVVDAPCSGSGLFRRDPEAISEWSENNVQLCTQRQQRIIADVLPALKEGGILIYSTCSYSKDEDENICKWIMDNFLIDNCKLSIENDWGIVASDAGYRCWPDKVKGEGFFLACFKKRSSETYNLQKIKGDSETLNNKELQLIENWVKQEGKLFIKHSNTVFAWPESLVNDFTRVLKKLRVIYSGVRVGELMRDKLVPDHALAMSKIYLNTINKCELDFENAIKYLQRKELLLSDHQKGWKLVTYEGYPLGWVNVLTNRVNNYYPKELRILKEELRGEQ